MKERPILFSAPMVRALLNGTKTQTRRAVKPQPDNEETTGACWLEIEGCHQFAWHAGEDQDILPNERQFFCPYGQPGDRLWVREAHAFSVRDPEGYDWHDDPENWDVIYRADERQPAGGWRDSEGNAIQPPWRPSIHMPRWASRITLEVTGVRLELLQDISEADAIAEGVYTDPACPAYDAYAQLWDEINGPGSWEANPWVWVVEFKKLEDA